MRYVLICFVILMALPVASDTLSDRPQGLMWHRSGLPAVFPLQIKSLPGEDYYLRLVNVETDEAVLAAYVRGGRFFRVLVPPGTFFVRFAAGTGWQGEEALFGPGGETRFFALPEPLTFGVEGFRTKAGHLIDLRDAGSGELAMLRGVELCQAMRVADGAGLVEPDADRRSPFWLLPENRDRIVSDRAGWPLQGLVRPAQC